MRTSSTSTLVRASYRWPMQGLGLSFGSEDVDNMIGTKVCEGCKVSFFFPKHPSLVSTVFGGRIPTARSSSCALWPWVSVRFFFVLAWCCSKTVALKIFCTNWRQLPTWTANTWFLARYAQQKGQKGSIECIQCITFAEDAKWNSHGTFS